MSRQTHHIKSDVTAFRVLEVLDRRGEAGVTRIANETGIAKSSVYKHLDTLKNLGYVRKMDGEYTLTLRWFQAGQRVRSRDPVFIAARSEVDRLSLKTGETVSLVVDENGDAVYLFQSNHDNEEPSPIREGEIIPSPLSIGGRAILSYSPTPFVRNVLAERNLDIEVEEFLSRLERLRDQRIVFRRVDPPRDVSSAGSLEGHRHVVVNNSHYQGMNGLAVPIRDSENRAVASIEVSGNASSLYGPRFETEIATMVVNACKQIEASLLDHGSA